MVYTITTPRETYVAEKAITGLAKLMTLPRGLDRWLPGSLLIIGGRFRGSKALSKDNCRGGPP